MPEWPQQKEWTVLAVREGKKNLNTHGEFQAFYIDFQGADDVNWYRKLPATVEVGKSYFGTISEGERGLRFKKETPGNGAGPEHKSTGGRQMKPESEWDPEKVARMGRAHAQGVAIRIMEYLQRQNTHPVDALAASGIGDPPEDTLGLLFAISDLLAQDVDTAGERAKAAASLDKPAEPKPAPMMTRQAFGNDEPVDETTMRNLCEAAGLDKVAAPALTEFICKRLNAEQKQRAKVGLETEPQVVVGQLRTAYGETFGSDLPEDGSDVPF